MPGAADWSGHRGGARGNKGVIHSLANAGSSALVLLAEEQPDKMVYINIYIHKHTYILTHIYKFVLTCSQHTLSSILCRNFKPNSENLF